MTRTSHHGTRIRRRSFIAGAAAGTVAAVPLRFTHAQGQKLKIGVLFPRWPGRPCLRGWRD